MNLQFQYPQAFWLLAIIPFFLLLFFFYLAWKRKSEKKLGEVKIVRALYKSYSPVKSVVKFLLLLLVFFLGCVALANPRKPDETSAEARKGIDIVIALDVSSSMLAQDITPDRLTRAKQFVYKLIDNLENDRIALVAFAGNAYLQMPLTFDASAAKMYVSVASPQAINVQGTSIGDALQKSEIAFGDQTERFRSIVLITDGETHDDNALLKAKELAAKGIMINTLGIGTTVGSTIMDTATHATKKDESGQTIVSQLNEQLLQQIALATNGTYVHLESSDAAVKQVVAQYAQIEKKALGDISSYTYQTFYAWMVVPMLLLAVVELFITDRKKSKQ